MFIEKFGKQKTKAKNDVWFCSGDHLGSFQASKINLFDRKIEIVCKKELFSWQNKIKNQCFVINHHLRYEFSHGTYLEMKISIGAFDCLNIMSVSLLGCSFVPGQGPWSLILDIGSWSLILDVLPEICFQTKCKSSGMAVPRVLFFHYFGFKKVSTSFFHNFLVEIHFS